MKQLLKVWLSRKLWMTLVGVAIVWGFYWHSVRYLFAFPDADHVTALVAMYRDAMVCIGSIVLGYLGINGVIQWRHGTSGAVSQALEKLERVERTFAPKHFDDGSVS